jgi:outer membrane protein
MQQSLKLSLLAVALAAGAAAQAQSTGNITARVGATHIAPSVHSGDISAPFFPGARANLGDDTQLSGGITYMVTPHWAVDVSLSTPFKHDLTGDGALAGVGKIGEAKLMPLSVLVQYRFGEANAKFRPYVGAGPTYAKFFKERSTNTLTALTGGTPANPTTLSMESRLAPTLQVGATVALNDRWFVDAMVAKTWLKTRTTLSTGQTMDLKLNPTTVAIAVGYRY